MAALNFGVLQETDTQALHALGQKFISVTIVVSTLLTLHVFTTENE